MPSGAALWLVVAVCIAGAVGIRQSDTLRVIARWGIDPLFHGTSDGGALFLLGGCAAIAVVLAVHKRMEPRWAGVAWLDRPDLGLALLGSVCFGLGLGLLMFFEYVEALDLPWQMTACHWAADANTCNTLLHSHVGKTALSTLAHAASGSAGQGEYDTGGVLLAHVPAGERWALAALFVLACLLTLAAAPSVARRYAWHPVALALYGFAALNCLQAMVDGGALTCRLPPSLLMLALLTAARDREHLCVLTRRYALPAAAGLALYTGGWYALSGETMAGALGGFITLLVLNGLGLLCWAFRAQARRGVRLFAVATGAGYLLLGYVQEGVSGIGLLLRALPAGAQVVVIDHRELVARDASAVVAGQTPLAIYRRFGDDPLKPGRVLIVRHPDRQRAAQAGPAAQGRELAIAVRVIDGKGAAARGARGASPGDDATAEARDGPQGRGGPVSPAPMSSLYLLLGATRTAERVNTAVFVFRTASPDIPPFFAALPSELSRNNYYVHLHLVAATLRSQGLEEFVLMPLLRTRDRDLFVPATRSAPRG
jgi:hypothetical protein